MGRKSFRPRRQAPHGSHHLSRRRANGHRLEVPPRSRRAPACWSIAGCSRDSSSCGCEIGSRRPSTSRRSTPSCSPMPTSTTPATCRGSSARAIIGPVYATEATGELAELIMLDSAKCQEQDADYANRKGYSKHKPALPLYDGRRRRTGTSSCFALPSAASGSHPPSRSGCAITTPATCSART